MRYLSNFINNIKTLFTNDVNMRLIEHLQAIQDERELRYGLMKYIHAISNSLGFDNIDEVKDLNIEGLKSDILTLNKRIDFIHTKLEKYQIKDIDMMKEYIEENTQSIDFIHKEIKNIKFRLDNNRNYKIETRKVFKDIFSRLEYHKSKVLEIEDDLEGRI